VTCKHLRIVIQLLISFGLCTAEGALGQTPAPNTSTGADVAATPSQQIKGKVSLAATGSPISGAKVYVKGKPDTAVITDASGSYCLKQLTSRFYTVVAENPRYYPSLRENVSAGADADFVLLEKKLVAYGPQAVVPKSELTPQVAEQLLPAAELVGDQQSILLLSNRMLVDDPNNQRLRLMSAQAQDMLQHDPAILTGLVVDKEGRIIPHTDVVVTNLVLHNVVTTKTDDRGRYRVSVFPLGDYQIEAQGSMKGATAVAVQPGTKSDYTVVRVVESQTQQP